MTIEVKDYEVTETRFIGGQHRKVGEPVQMTVSAAKYYMEPHGTGLKVAAIDAEAQAASEAEAQAASEAEAQAASEAEAQAAAEAEAQAASGKKRK